MSKKIFEFGGTLYESIFITGLPNAGKTRLAHEISLRFPDVNIYDVLWYLVKHYPTRVDFKGELNIYTGNAQDIQLLPDATKTLVLDVLRTGETMNRIFECKQTFESIEDVLNNLRVTTPSSKDKHNCYCELASLLRIGCKCGGI